MSYIITPIKKSSNYFSSSNNNRPVELTTFKGDNESADGLERKAIVTKPNTTRKNKFIPCNKECSRNHSLLNHYPNPASRNVMFY